MKELFLTDPRTMWAWADYLESQLDLPISDAMARQILEAIPDGDHVEVFGAAMISREWSPSDEEEDTVPDSAIFSARTFSTWIIPSSAVNATVIPASDTHWSCGLGPSSAHWLSVSIFSLSNGLDLYAFADESRIDRFSEGAGQSILRIPDNPLAPIPHFEESPRQVEAISPPSRRLLSDWHSAEDVAVGHMCTTLGLFDARLTGGVSDRGIDVEHPDAVAQVKMQATPVGSPQIRQLRGARPHLDGHIFYSTSGYTQSAIQEAAETNVALFTIAEDASVLPHGHRAEDLVMDGYRRRGGAEALVATYVNEVVGRITQAKRNYGNWKTGMGFVNHDALEALGRDEVVARAQLYLMGAIEAVEEAPMIGRVPNRTVVSHFRNADLRAAFCCSVLGLPYPGDRPISGGSKQKAKKLSAADFY